MSAFLETLRKIGHSRTTPLICPRCGSPRISQQGNLSGWLTPSNYLCRDCGYSGSLIVERAVLEGAESE